MIRLFYLASLLVFLSGPVHAQGSLPGPSDVMEHIARDSVDVCIRDLMGGDSKALLASRGYAPGTRTLRTVYYEKTFAFTTEAGRKLSYTHAIGILKRDKRKRLSKCEIRPNLRSAAANAVYRKMQAHAVRSGYRNKPSRNAITYTKDGFSFGLRGKIHTSYVSITFVRY